MSGTAPPDEVSIDARVVRALLESQHADLAALPLGRRHEGWDMAMFRLGDSLAVRLPRRAAAVGSLEVELQWVPQLSAGWTFPTQRIDRVGGPGAGYPWPWAVVTWLPGTDAATTPLGASAGPALGRALAEVHRPAPPEAPFNSEQSIALEEREAGLLGALEAVATAAPGRGLRLDRDRALSLWRAARAAPEPVPRRWIHADLHPFNIVSQEGDFGGIVDWADVAAGDPATDLGFLHLDLPREGVQAAFDAYAAATGELTAATLARARGVGVALAAGFASWDAPATSAIGWRALRELGVVAP